MKRLILFSLFFLLIFTIVFPVLAKDQQRKTSALPFGKMTPVVRKAVPAAMAVDLGPKPKNLRDAYFNNKRYFERLSPWAQGILGKLFEGKLVAPPGAGKHGPRKANAPGLPSEYTNVTVNNQADDTTAADTQSETTIAFEPNSGTI